LFPASFSGAAMNGIDGRHCPVVAGGELTHTKIVLLR
jgi:hypothetical protein